MLIVDVCWSLLVLSCELFAIGCLCVMRSAVAYCVDGCCVCGVCCLLLEVCVNCCVLLLLVCCVLAGHVCVACCLLFVSCL